MRARVVLSLVFATLLCAGCTETRPAPPADATGSPAAVATVSLAVSACEPKGWCVGAGANPTAASASAALEISHGGRERWVTGAIPELPGTTLQSAACWSSGCLLGGGAPSGAVLVLVDPTHRVASRIAAPPGASVEALACPGPGRCLALVGTSSSTLVDATTTSGASWSRRGQLPAGLATASSLACTTALACVAAGTGVRGGAIAVTADGGARWREVGIPAVVSIVTSVACATGLGCFATARQHDGVATLLASADGTSGWRLAVPPIPGAAAVACAPQVCVLGGGSTVGELAARSPGGPWRGLRLAYVPLPLVALGCATALRCVGVTPSSTVSIRP